MNPLTQKNYKLGPAIRNICDDLINQLNFAVTNMANSKLEKGDKIREFKDKIKTDFHPVLRQVIKSMKNLIKINEGKSAINCLNTFYDIMNENNGLISNFSFLNNMLDIYIFPEFNINDTLDFIFEGCSNDLRQKFVDEKLLDYIKTKNLYDDNDIRFQFNNNYNNIDYNDEEKKNPCEQNINLFSDKNNQIYKNILKNITEKIDEINKIIISTKEGFNENNFKLYFDKNLCVKLYNNFEIKFVITRLYFNIQEIIPEINTIPYIILPVEIRYNNQIINLNDKEEIYYNKNDLLSKNDLQFLINKFKLKIDFSDVKDKVVCSLNKTDFLEKCLLFKKFTDELFNNKFENLKKEIKIFLAKYDFPIKLEEKNNSNMDIENMNEKNEEDNINEIIVFYNFPFIMKKKNEFYFKLIFNKERPTNIKLVYSHYILTNNNQNVLIIEGKEFETKFDMKFIKDIIIHLFDVYKRILMNWIGKKLRYVYPIYFDTIFTIYNIDKICFGMKKYEKFIKYFSLHLNDKGKLCFENLLNSKIFTDDFKEINSILTNYLKCEEDDERINDYVIQFNEYIKNILIEKIFSFSEDKIKLIELNNNTGILNFHIYDSYSSDKNIDTYFDIKCDLYKNNNQIIKDFQVREIRLICENNKKENEKIILNCNCKKEQEKTNIEKYEEFFRNLINKLKIKYGLCMANAYDVLKLALNKKTIFEFTKPLLLKENDIINDNIKNKEINQWIEISMKNEDCCIINKQFKDKLMVYFNKIKISKENNIFKFYLNDNIIKLKYSKIPNLIYQKYACMIQNYILDYESTEDTISITIFGKMKVEYSNKIQLVFEEFIPRIISYMETIFKLVDYLLKNNSVPEIKLCPLYTYIQIPHENFKHHLDYKFHYEKPYFSVDGNFNPIINKYFVKIFGEQLLSKEYNYSDKEYFRNKCKNFYFSYRIYDLFINQYKFKISVFEYPYNHFQSEASNIYFLIKDFNILQLISLNNLVLVLQIREDNNIYLEFRDKINEDIENDMFSLFNNKLIETKIDYKINYEQENKYKKIIIYIDDGNDDNKFFKLNEIIKIFISLSKLN